MNPVEWLWWKQYYNYRPFGDMRDDLRTALSTKLLLTPYIKKSTSIPLSEFMLQPPEDLMPSANELTDKLTALFGGS